LAVAEVFQHRGTKAETVQFNTLQLRFTSSNEWNDAQWEFAGDRSRRQFPASQVEEICSTSGDFSIQAVLSGYPAHSFCFLFRADQDGMWSGHTVTKSFGQLVVVAYRFDPS
jgi:hypothetical protein